MTKPRPKTGEERDVNRQLKIDALPQSARDAILALRDMGDTWPQIEARSARPYSKDWSKDGGGFIQWEELETRVLEEFPDLRIPKSSLHRWFDLRIAQVRKQVLIEGEKSREWAAALATKTLPDANQAVVNAMRDQVFSLMRTVGTADQGKFIEGLNQLALTMSRLQRVELLAKQVSVNERKVAQLEQDAEMKRKRFEGEMNAAEKKITRGEAVTAEDINRIRERVFGIGPSPTPA
jgi:hypothetical protein